jgi:hypothetical protein
VCGDMMDKASQNFDKERSLRYWTIESPTYNFSTSLSTLLAQPHYLIYKIGGDEVWITAKIATTYMVKAVMFHIWPTYIQKYGIRKISIIFLIAKSPIPLIFMLARSFASLIALEVYSAIWWSPWDLCTGLYNLYLLPKEKRASILAVITLTTPLI